jgi:hypothetical protein
VTKKVKRNLYRFLTRTCGDPRTMTETQRRRILILLGGWVGQHVVPARRQNMRFNLAIIPRPTVYSKPPPLNVFEKRASGLYVAQPGWHWQINSRVMLPLTKTFMPKYDDPTIYASRDKGWDWVEKQGGKCLSVVIPVNYRLTVPKDIQIIGRKMIQRVWNHRVYSDKETWECSFWDFSCLNRDEDSFNEVKWAEGYVCKMATGSAVETTLARAIAMAKSRTIKSGFKSVLSDHVSR